MAGVIEGTIKQFPDIVDLLRTRKETGVITLIKDSKSDLDDHLTRLFFKNGVLIHASDGLVEGDQVVYQASSWQDGRFSYEAGPVNIEGTIDAAQALLLFESIELMRRKKSEGSQTSVAINPSRPKIKGGDGILHSIALPAGDYVHYELKTDFVNLAGLIDELRQNTFSGYLTMAGQRTEGLILFHRGQMSDIYFYTRGGQVLVGTEGMRSMMSVASASGGVITASRLSDAFLASYSSLLYGKVIHNLDVKIVKIQALVASLQEDSFTGCLKTQPPNEHTEGYFFFYEGEMIGGYYRDGSMLRSGIKAAQKILQTSGTRIMVFQTITQGEARDAIAAHPITGKNFQLLIDVTQRCLDTLGDLAGKNKLYTYFEQAQSEASSLQPWVRELKFLKNGTLDGSAVDQSSLTVQDALDAFMIILNRCVEQGSGVFGGKIIETKLSKKVEDLRDDLAAIGFPDNWPG